MKTRSRVLVVAADEMARHGYAASLGADYDTRTAADAGEALREMQRKPADVVLLDERAEVLAALKKSWPQCEVVVMTRSPSIESAKDAVRNGAFDYLAKPVRPDQVTGAARKALLHKLWALREAIN